MYFIKDTTSEKFNIVFFYSIFTAYSGKIAVLLNDQSICSIYTFLFCLLQFVQLDNSISLKV